LHKLQAVIRREFVERIRTRAFVISTILFPLIWAGVIYFQATVADRQTRTSTMVIVDAAGGSFGSRIESTLREARLDTKDSFPAFLVTRVVADGRLALVKDSAVRLVGLRGDKAEHLDGVLVLDDSSVSTGRIKYLGSNVASPAEMRSLEHALEPVLLVERLVRNHVDEGLVRSINGRIDLETKKVSEGKETGTSGSASFLIAYMMGFILYIALLMYGIQVMSSVLEEKTSRIIEVLASSLSPFELMLGKVIGVGSVGLFQLSIWIGAAYLISTGLGRSLGLSAMSRGDLNQPGIGTQIPSVSPELVVVFLVFFLLGFFLYASLYAAVGAMCSSQQDTQQANTPVTLGIVAGFLTMFPLLNEPNGTLGRVLSLVPFVAPFATPIRYSVSPLPLSEVALSVLATGAGTLAMVWLGSRIYRVGILSYGKRPSLRDLVRWVRTP
jgi:ABC-2 type transport system permease protein